MSSMFQPVDISIHSGFKRRSDSIPSFRKNLDGSLVSISDFITVQERQAAFNRYFDLFDAALSEGFLAKLGKLHTLAAYWNGNSTIHCRLTEAAKTQAIFGHSLPESRVNNIAYEIYTQIDGITGKYDNIA
jgi:hypothetical protein